MHTPGLDFGSREAARLFTFLKLDADNRAALSLRELAGLMAHAYNVGKVAGELEGKAACADVFASTVQNFNAGAH